MLAPKLRPGSHIRLIAPSCTLPSLPWLTDDILERGKAVFAEHGITVTEGKHLRDVNEFQSTSIEARIEDLHAAFGDPSVHGIACIRGGWNANQLLKYIDYDLIKANPKIFWGFSDITVLQNAFFQKTGLVTYSGPNFTQFCMGTQLRYAHEYFFRCAMEEGPFTIEHSKEWTNEYYDPLHPNRKFEANEGPWVVQEGKADGTIVGGNLCTLNLLQGTEFMPPLHESIVFIEEDYGSPIVFERNLQSLLHMPGSEGIRGLVIGRFQKQTEMTKALLEQICYTKKELNAKPIIANADFGHTHPMYTFPIGGTARIKAVGTHSAIEILKH